MIDKDDYDYCAHCDVEPPALKFKCPECKHNPDKEQIIIDGKIYNYCNGCELWNGHHCTADRSYEFNAENHGIICDKHMAHQFWKIRRELIRKTQECKKLKEQLQASQPTGICETCMAKAILQNDKYRKALEEIENFINYEFLGQNEWVKTSILDIINKAKGKNLDEK